jgi:hypothetical protein
MSATQSFVIELLPSIDSDNQLQLTFRDGNGKLVLWRPGTGVEDLLPVLGDAASLTLEINDFFQYGSLYAVYGAVLVPHGSTVAAYWEPTGRGQRYTLVARTSEVPAPRLLIGAAPRMPGAPVPALFRSSLSGGDGFPEDEPDHKAE